ncbi:MAG TPA: phosphoribosyltransferase family protein [Candidatus Limnocylindrales bacterium]|nr:phosphoribosyltransferase family protein [Candidatus Limnocylindrales bacterium]
MTAAPERAGAAARTEAIFHQAGALRNGHFRLKSGRHGDRYLEKFQVLQFPAAVTALCQDMATFGRAADGSPAVDLVVGPTTGGVILAFETARQLGLPGFFAEEVAGAAGTPARREFRRGFRIEPGQRVLLVDDVLTTGGSLERMVPPIEAAGGELQRCVVLVDRSGGLAEISGPSGRRYPVEALWTLDLPTYEPGPASCPGCAADLPLEAPGSSGAAGS